MKKIMKNYKFFCIVFVNNTKNLAVYLNLNHILKKWLRYVRKFVFKLKIVKYEYIDFIEFFIRNI